MEIIEMFKGPAFVAIAAIVGAFIGAVFPGSTKAFSAASRSRKMIPMHLLSTILFGAGTLMAAMESHWEMMVLSLGMTVIAIRAIIVCTRNNTGETQTVG